MPIGLQFEHLEHATLAELRMFADQAFSRVAGAPLRTGNTVRLLKDAEENYPAWLDAIAGAKHHVFFENYLIHEDHVGQKFADALIAKSLQGIDVYLIYDWMGCLGKASRRFWNQLREGGVNVRRYNPLDLDRPLSWLSRDHRKMLAVDGKVGFISGLCIGRMWEGQPEKNLEPWRDTGVEIQGPAVGDIEQAFSRMWEMTGHPLPGWKASSVDPHATGDMNVRVVATVPATAGLFRLDQLVAALARKRLWLTDSYFAGTSAYIQTLTAAAKDGVDVRLLVPNSTDIPVLRPLSSAGYRPLLKAGVRIFEWKGKMLHAKTALADDRWARIGSTNLNISSWFGNCELDAVVEDRAFALKMEETYLEDLTNSTEIILDAKRKTGIRPRPLSRDPRTRRSGGSVGRATAGALRIGNAVGAAFTDRRVLEPVEARLMMVAGALLLTAAVVTALFPAVVAYPLSILSVWFGGALLYRSFLLRREGRRRSSRGRDGSAKRSDV